MTRLNLLAAAVIACLATTAPAQDAETCVGDGMLAGMFMQHRQHGGNTVNEMMEKFGSEPGLRAMILDAYNQPVMQTPATRRLMVDEFVNKWSVKCYNEGPAIPRVE